MISAKLYAVALYVNPDLASRELGVRARGNFFETDQDYCEAGWARVVLLGGCCRKAQVRLQCSLPSRNTFVTASRLERYQLMLMWLGIGFLDKKPQCPCD